MIDGKLYLSIKEICDTVGMSRYRMKKIYDSGAFGAPKTIETVGNFTKVVFSKEKFDSWFSIYKLQGDCSVKKTRSASKQREFYNALAKNHPCKLWTRNHIRRLYIRIYGLDDGGYDTMYNMIYTETKHFGDYNVDGFNFRLVYLAENGRFTGNVEDHVREHYITHDTVSEIFGDDWRLFDTIDDNKSVEEDTVTVVFDTLTWKSIIQLYPIVEERLKCYG